MRRSVRLEVGYPSLDQGGSFAAQDGVDQAVELGGELDFGERVLSVAGGMGQLANQLGAVVKGHGHAVGNGRGIADREQGIFDDRGAAIRSMSRGSCKRSGVNWAAETSPSTRATAVQ